ncbi:HAD family hydrolase [Sediminibacterium sp.]|jgi:putative hydrolase of the HAD superfamily|uniref:HAD family hydrolase n=1 Tax=Sediminibacterium sp. TaxID=1917865 RepID=UPI0025CD70C7|nr:HAD family hydrolase [Sediminibacterium sp.]MBW0178002.1 HAD family hydrolase [Sediminibacterium sp.]
MNDIKVIAFDADDTLWVNEPYFRETEDRFCELLEDYLPHHSIARELLQVEIRNINLYGYGVKGFMLSMIEAAMELSQKTIKVDVIEKIIALGKELLEKPIVLLDEVEDVLQALHGKYKLVVATKGDLLDQERKLRKSGLEHYFHHIEIMSEKRETDYQKLLKHLDIQPAEFMMLGNSLKSDVLPVLELGAHAVHIPYHTTWAHETIDKDIDHLNFRQVESIKEVLSFLLK